MAVAAFTTLGCKVNQYETQRILDDFEAFGFTITEFNRPADIYVINTCSVTQAAERKSRAMARRAARQNPEAIVVLTGCYGEMAKIKGELVEEASLLVPNHEKLKTLDRVLERYPELKARAGDAPLRSGSAPRRTRATIKVQDGCNVFCSFCSIPFTRKFMSSRPLPELLREAEKRVEQGYRELVVTGVLVGAYGEDDFTVTPGASLPRKEAAGGSDAALAAGSTGSTVDLADCLLALAAVPGIERVRLSSIEPTQVTDRLLEAFASEPKLCRHLHIPLQSGDSGVLRRMNRPYDREFYIERCREAAARIPDLAITSDIMVGFPGEDRAAFMNTIDIVERVGFARAHLFRYSPRPNTPAADYVDQVPDGEKEARSRELAAACRESQQRFIQRFLGRTLEVLVEGRESAGESAGDEPGLSGNDDHSRIESSDKYPAAAALLGGYTSNYIRVEFTGGSHLVGTVTPVQLVEPSSFGAIGIVGGAHFGPDEAPPDADFIPLTAFAGRLGPQPSLSGGPK